MRLRWWERIIQLAVIGTVTWCAGLTIGISLAPLLAPYLALN